MCSRKFWWSVSYLWILSVKKLLTYLPDVKLDFFLVILSSVFFFNGRFWPQNDRWSQIKQTEQKHHHLFLYLSIFKVIKTTFSMVFVYSFEPIFNKHKLNRESIVPWNIKQMNVCSHPVWLKLQHINTEIKRLHLNYERLTCCGKLPFWSVRAWNVHPLVYN